MTLPSTAGLPSGWSIGFTTDNGKGLTVTVNGSNGGQIFISEEARRPAVTSVSLAGNQFEFVMLQYDGMGISG